jgi:hypothetical protein
VTASIPFFSGVEVGLEIHAQLDANLAKLKNNLDFDSANEKFGFLV